MGTDPRRCRFQERRQRGPTMSWLGTKVHQQFQPTSRATKSSHVLHTGGLSPTKNELTGGESQAIWPPARPAAELVEIGPKMPRSAKAWNEAW